MAKGILREYGKVAPTFWTGPTGKQLRARGRDAQVLACYLFTAPSSNMMCLYYLPLPTLCHEAGFTLEGARATLAILEELEFAYYDDEAELVWVVEGARYQVADHLAPSDNRVRGIVKELESFVGHPYAKAFYERYKEAFSLPTIIFKKALPRPFTAPERAAKPLPSQKKKQKQEQEQKQEQNSSAAGAAAPAGKSWSAEAVDDWTEFLGEAHGGPIGAHLKPLEQEHGWDVVRPVWRWACRRAAASNAPEKWTPAGFARSFKALRDRYHDEAAGGPARASPPPLSLQDQALIGRRGELAMEFAE